VTKPQHRADMFIDPETDPREGGVSLGDERATLSEFLRGQRLTLQIKCQGLDAAQLARRAVEPSTMSLLGLVRHLAEVERKWFRQRFAGQTYPICISLKPSPTATSMVPPPSRPSWMSLGGMARRGRLCRAVRQGH
jgi:Protein of unknown function (DUF664)